jgi:hypothetical protein
MVTRRPLRDGEALGLERLWDVVEEAGLEVDDAGGRVQAGPVHGIPGALAVVEHAGDDLEERASKPRATCRPERQR